MEDVGAEYAPTASASISATRICRSLKITNNHEYRPRRIPALRISANATMPFVPDSFGPTGRSSREFQSYIQRIHELIDLDWFGEIPEESCKQALLDVAWHCICTESHDGDVPRCRVFAKEFHGFDTTDARQIDIHQDHIRKVGTCKLDSQISISGTQHAHIRASCDKLFDQLQVGRVVLHIEQRP